MSSVTYMQRSFESIGKWINNIEQHASADVCKVLVGNKCDEYDKRVIAYATAKVGVIYLLACTL